jgi:hypothetical protein
MKQIKKLKPVYDKNGTYRCVGLFLCDLCGKEVIRKTDQAKRQNSCGCNKNNYNGGSKSRIYNTWVSMVDRCNNKFSKYYRYYGGRGIIICDDWFNSFLIFREWAFANGYSDKLVIDRIDVDGNYEPLNCRFVSYGQSGRNKRNVIMSWPKVNIIRGLYSSGVITLAKLADIFETSESNISFIVNFKRWKS